MNRKLNKLLMGLALVGSLALMTGCNASLGGGEDPDDINAQVIAKVNGDPVYRWQLNYNFLMAKNNFASMGLQIPEDMNYYVEQQALNSCFRDVIINQEAKKNNLTADSKFVDQYIEYNKSGAGSQDEYEVLLDKYSLTEDRFKEVAGVLSKSNQLGEMVTKDITATDEEAAKEYADNAATWNVRKASHILIKVDMATATDADKTAAKKKAEDLIVRLNNGEDFATLAKEFSDDGSAAAGGVLDSYIPKDDQNYIPEFVSEVWSFEKVGDYSKKPLESTYGYHIVKVDEIIDTFDEAKEEIKTQIANSKKSDFYSQYLQKLLDTAEIDIEYEPQYTKPEEQPTTPEGTTPDGTTPEGTTPEQPSGTDATTQQAPPATTK